MTCTLCENKESYSPDYSKTLLQTAYDLGVVAAWSGSLYKLVNPFQPDSLSYQQWRDGYNVADVEVQIMHLESQLGYLKSKIDS